MLENVLEKKAFPHLLLFLKILVAYSSLKIKSKSEMQCTCGIIFYLAHVKSQISEFKIKESLFKRHTFHKKCKLKNSLT